MQSISNLIKPINQKMIVRNHSNQKVEITFKYPNTLETRKGFCEKHNHNYTDEYVGMPSGKQRWLGCDMCRYDILHQPVTQQQLAQYQAELTARNKHNNQGKSQSCTSVGYIEFNKGI
jgi:hypothetical protein